MAIIVQDAFTDTNGTNITAHTPDTAPGGAAWANAAAVGSGSNVSDIQSNAIRITSDLHGAVIDSGIADAIIAVDWTPDSGGSNNRADIYVRYGSDGNLLFLRARKDEGDLLIVRVVGGTGTTLASTSFTFITGVTYRLMVRTVGTGIEGYIDGVRYLSTTDSTYTSNTKHGFGRGVGNSNMRWDNFQIDSNYTNSGIITITSPVNYQTYQRDGSSQASISVAGTYTGTSTSIELRYGSGAWTTPSSIGGGSFSHTFTGQVAGQATLQARYVSTTPVVPVFYVGIGDIFIIAGQSNASGQGTNNQSYYNSGMLRAALFGNDYTWKNLADPTDSSNGQIDTVSSDAGAAGSMWPNLATAFMENLSIPCAFVPCALGATSITQWQPGSNHQDRTTLYGSMVYRALQTGAKAVLWHQGEKDAIDGMSQATYNSYLDTLANSIMSDLGIKLMPCKLQNSTDRDETAVNAAIAEAWGDNSNVLTGPDFSDITPSADAVHFKTNSEMITGGYRWWRAMVVALYTPGATDARALRPDVLVSEDTSIVASSATFNWGILTTINVGGNASGSKQRGLVRFANLTDIPSGSTIVSAALRVYCESELASTDYTVNAHRMLVQFYEGLKNGAAPGTGEDGSTYNLRNANGSVAWAGGAGMGSGSDYAASATGSVSITGTGYFDLDVTADVQTFIDGTYTNYGWALINTSETTANSLKRFTSSDSSPYSQFPVLVVSWITTGGLLTRMNQHAAYRRRV